MGAIRICCDGGYGPRVAKERTAGVVECVGAADAGDLRRRPDYAERPGARGVASNSVVDAEWVVR